MPSFSKQRSSAGFTLVEVLIAAVIASIAIAAGFEVFINHNKSHQIQANITDMQQRSRAALDELIENIRRAGYLLPDQVQVVDGYNTDPDTIEIAFMSEPVCTATLTSAMLTGSDELQCDSSDDSVFEDYTWAFIVDPVADTGEYFYITHVSTGNRRLQHSGYPLSRPYPAGSEIFTVERIKYYVDNFDTLHPILMVEEFGGYPEIYADNVVDLQFRYVQANGSVVDTVLHDRFVREVLVSVVTVTPKDDLFLTERRYDTLSTRVKIRNL
jgi:prepilin-type N-terminal cleavage/methylation domain-containing protein